MVLPGLVGLLEVEAVVLPDDVHEFEDLQGEHVLAKVIAVLEDELEVGLVEAGVVAGVFPCEVERPLG